MKYSFWVQVRNPARRSEISTVFQSGIVSAAYFTIATLTVQVYTYAIAPYADWHRQAWAGALVLVTIVLLCSLLARIATSRMERLQRGG